MYLRVSETIQELLWESIHVLAVLFPNLVHLARVYIPGL